MMTEELKGKWLTALRSGDYAQTRTALVRDYPEGRNGEYPAGYCCLGVLAVQMGLDPHDEDAYNPVEEALDGTGVTLSSCWVRNDSHRMPFPRIADWLADALEVTG